MGPSEIVNSFLPEPTSNDSPEVSNDWNRGSSPLVAGPSITTWGSTRTRYVPAKAPSSGRWEARVNRPSEPPEGRRLSLVHADDGVRRSGQRDLRRDARPGLRLAEGTPFPRGPQNVPLRGQRLRIVDHPRPLEEIGMRLQDAPHKGHVLRATDQDRVVVTGAFPEKSGQNFFCFF